MGTYNALKSLEIRQKVGLLGKLLALYEKVQAGMYPSGGICSQVAPYQLALSDYFETWPKYSGNRNFPIVNPSGSYNDAYYEGTLWANDAYGNARRALLTHCIKELRTELAQYHALMLGLQEVYKAPGLSGICHQRALLTALECERNLPRLFVGWPLYSGDIDFPVPEDSGYISPENQYFSGCRWSGTYGERRRDLLAYCIDQLKTGLGSYTP